MHGHFSEVYPRVGLRVCFPREIWILRDGHDPVLWLDAGREAFEWWHGGWGVLWLGMKMVINQGRHKINGLNTLVGCYRVNENTPGFVQPMSSIQVLERV